MVYQEYSEKNYNEIYQREYIRILNGKTSDNAIKTAERRAQHIAIFETFTKGYEKFSDVATAADIWYSIYSAHIRRKAGNFNSSNLIVDQIDKVVSGHQSWIKCSGHVFEHYIVNTTRDRLSTYGIRFLLQKELSQMLKKNQIYNPPEDNIDKLVKNENFDIYAVLKVNDHDIVFGCIQAKTSIRDRVGRDRDFSIPVMEMGFWSPAITIDGSFLNNPKYQNMVNGGGKTEYEKNGWHGMYAMSRVNNNDRIYHDKHLDLLIEHASQAALTFCSNRLRVLRDWNASHIQH